MTFIYGIAGCALGIALFLGGLFAGVKLHRSMASPAVSASETEQRRLAEEQTAFRTLQNYSAERAYGIHTGGIG